MGDNSCHGRPLHLCAENIESNELYGLVQCHAETPLYVLKRYLYTEQHLHFHWEKHLYYIQVAQEGNARSPETIYASNQRL